MSFFAQNLMSLSQHHSAHHGLRGCVIWTLAVSPTLPCFIRLQAHGRPGCSTNTRSKLLPQSLPAAFPTAWNILTPGNPTVCSFVMSDLCVNTTWSVKPYSTTIHIKHLPAPSSSFPLHFSPKNLPPPDTIYMYINLLSVSSIPSSSNVLFLQRTYHHLTTCVCVYTHI